MEKGGYKKSVAGGGFDLQWEGWKYFKEMGRLTRKGRGKIDGGCDPQRKRNYVHYAGKQLWGNFPFFTEIFVLTKRYSFMDKGIVCKFTL